MKSNNGFDSESELSGEDAGFVSGGISEEDIYDDGDDDIEQFPQIATRMVATVETAQSRKTVEVNEKIEIPSFFELPEVKRSRVFEIENIAAVDAPDMDGKVSIDLDNDDPVATADKVKHMYLLSQVKADICAYIGAEEFNSVVFEDLLALIDVPKDIENKEIYLLEVVEKLIHNGNLKTKKEFLQKLYKLRPTKVLIEEALMADGAYQKCREYKLKVKELICEWEKSVKEKIEDDFRRYKSLCVVSGANNGEIEELREKNEVLQDKYNNEINKLNNKVDDYKKLHENFLLKVSEVLDGEELESPEEILALIEERIKQGNGASFENEIASLKEEIGIIKESSGDLEDQLNGAVAGKKSVEAENEKLIQEISRLESLLMQKRDVEVDGGTKKDKEEEEDKEAEDENEDEEDSEKKPNKKTKNIIVAILSILVVLGGLFLFLGWFLAEDKPVENVAYATPSAANETNPAVIPAANEINPAVIPAAVGMAPVVQAPEVLSQYDFGKTLPEEEFKNQKFDIYLDNLTNIKINGKDFVANDVINSYRFIKATSAGKILFIKENKEPLWVEMK